MALFIRQDENRSELQKKLARELQEGAIERDKKREKELMDSPDGIEDSRYVEGFKKTTSLGWVWLLIVILFLIIIVWLTVLNITR